MKHLFLIAVLLLSSTTAFSAYYFRSGEMEVIGTENAFISLTAGFGLLALIVVLGLYLWNNSHSMWFVSPTINGWGTTLLCIIPTIGISTVIVGEFIGALCGMFRNLVNLLYALLLGLIVFLICRAVYLEVMDLVALMILSLSGAVFRSSSDTGTLIDLTTGEFISGVTFSGNKAYSGNKTFTNDGSGFFE